MGSSLADNFFIIGSLLLGGGNNVFNGFAEMFLLGLGALVFAGNAALSAGIGVLNFLQTGLGVLPAPLFSFGLGL